MQRNIIQAEDITTFNLYVMSKYKIYKNYAKNVTVYFDSLLAPKIHKSRCILNDDFDVQSNK